jgi:RNA polymerase sigma-70 factor (ECF subfamily)
MSKAERTSEKVQRRRFAYTRDVHASAQTPTDLLLAWRNGDRAAFDRLVPLVSHELRQLAGQYLHRERNGHTLQPTALVNEAYLRLVDLNRIQWQDRAHFFAMAARTMRRILVDHARARDNDKRGGRTPKVPMELAMEVAVSPEQHLVELDEALQRLEAVHPRKAHVVELRFFTGLSLEETATALHVSIDTVKRDWRFAKLCLLRDLAGGGSTRA